MAVEATPSDVLQELGVSYPQLIDYTSKAYTATLVGSTIPCRSFTYTDVGSGLRFGFAHMGLYYYLVCTLLPSALLSLTPRTVTAKWLCSGKPKDAYVGRLHEYYSC